MKINIPCDFGTDDAEFEHYVGRKPRKGELKDWAHKLKKGMDAQLDWQMICKVSAKDFKVN